MPDAVKCPDCGTWWRGQEHRCPPVVAGNGTTWPGNYPLGPGSPYRQFPTVTFC